ncbi:MAG: 50S ribosomal protein L32 [Deltaproteobacteria bacterium]|jgi:large subunit ribosomal protein L32|nr:50S ribosomal protein L32 [Deltaproteobacteria bacterium]
MPTPKKKTSRSKRDMRRSHDGLELPAVGFDKKTGEFHKPHHAYKADDGAFYYKGKQIIPPKVKKEVQEEAATNE